MLCFGSVFTFFIRFLLRQPFPVSYSMFAYSYYLSDIRNCSDNIFCNVLFSLFFSQTHVKALQVKLSALVDYRISFPSFSILIIEYIFLIIQN
jgi:hypothetical protein